MWPARRSGVGKTTTAHLVSKELGYDVMELNASDTRSKKLLEQSMSDAMTSTSLSKASKKRVRPLRYGPLDQLEFILFRNVDSSHG